jgi:hypothetical protein
MSFNSPSGFNSLVKLLSSGLMGGSILVGCEFVCSGVGFNLEGVSFDSFFMSLSALYVPVLISPFYSINTPKPSLILLCQCP